jgi:hypothetical protein
MKKETLGVSARALFEKLDSWLCSTLAIRPSEIGDEVAPSEGNNKIMYECVDLLNADRVGRIGRIAPRELMAVILIVGAGTPAERVARIAGIYASLTDNSPYVVGDDSRCQSIMAQMGIKPRPAVLIYAPLVIDVEAPEAKEVTQPLVINMR